MKNKNPNDKWVTGIGLSVPLLLQLVNEKGIHLPQTKMEVLFTLVGFATITGIWMIIFVIVKKVRAAYPSVSLSRKRFLVTGLVCLPIIYGINLVVVYSGFVLGMENAPPPTLDALIRFLTGVALVLWIITGMYEAGYYHQLLRQAQKERNDLLYLQKHHQLDDLKNKVNPHFLFNSLNTVSYLIYEDSAKAEKFVEELSTVYRYLLRNNEERMTTLNNEYTFIQSYILLLQMRFGEGLQTSFTIDPLLLQHQLPPLSLQVLVENAVKHNTISTERTLHISIGTEDETLVVKNNLQRKQQSLPTEKTGLSYLLSRYTQAGEDGPDITETEAEFIVRLPLLPPSPLLSPQTILQTANGLK